MNFNVQTIYWRPSGGRIATRLQVVADSAEQAERMARAITNLPIREVRVRRIGALHHGFYVLTMDNIDGEKAWTEAYAKGGAA